MEFELELADEDQPVLYVQAPRIAFHRVMSSSSSSVDPQSIAFHGSHSHFSPSFSSYKVGETFLHMPHSRATNRLLHDQSVLDKELSGLEEKKDECEKGMKELKVLLYAKFGKAINLDE